MKFFINRLTLLLLLAIIPVAGCSFVIPGKEPATLYEHLSAEPGTLNPVIVQDAYGSAINAYIYETLLDMDRDTLKQIPMLAERWTISPDKMTYRFFLRKGVKWSDGVEFNADDVLYSFKVVMDPKTANAHRKGEYVDIKGLRKIDRYTVEFDYKRLYYLALQICGGMPIIPKHIFDDGTDINSHKNNRFPIGTGPYKFERWDTGKRIILTRNENYWGKKPEIKRILYKVVTEETVALQMLKKGDLDLMSLRPIQWVRQTNSDKFNEHFYKLQYYTPNFRYIGWNARRPLFADRRVRIAMTHMVNRDLILKRIIFGLGRIVTGNFYIFSKDYNTKIQPYDFNPAKARALLAAAGWRDTDGDGILDRKGKKFSFVFTIPADMDFGEQLTTILKEDLSKVGIEMTIVRYEWAVFVEKLNKHDFDAVTLGWSLGYDSDPYAIWHSSQTAEGGFNFCYFRNAEADRLILEARQEFDENKRMKLYHRFHEIIHEEQPYTFLFCNATLVVVDKRFDNVIVHKTGLDIRDWKVKKEQ